MFCCCIAKGLLSARPHACYRFRRYVCEDRYSAIRWAIAAAQKGDVVVIAGKGDRDWTEVSDGEGGYIRVCHSLQIYNKDMLHVHLTLLHKC